MRSKTEKSEPDEDRQPLGFDIWWGIISATIYYGTAIAFFSRGLNVNSSSDQLLILVVVIGGALLCAPGFYFPIIWFILRLIWGIFIWPLVVFATRPLRRLAGRVLRAYWRMLWPRRVATTRRRARRERLADGLVLVVLIRLTALALARSRND